MKEARNIGLGIESPAKKWEGQDKKCPYFGNIALRGRSFVGTVVKKDTHRSATVEWTRKVMVKKYERYEQRKSNIRAHNPEVINAEIGDKVIVHECRPLSKTKSAVIIQKLGSNLDYLQKQENIDNDKKSQEQGE